MNFQASGHGCFNEGTATHWLVRRCIEVARIRYSDHNLTLIMIVHGLQTSPGYLGRLFRMQVGVSFKRYLLELRMQSAAEALQDGKSVKEVGLSSGYLDPAHFIRDFKGRFGSTPGKRQASCGGLRHSTPPTSS